MNTTIMSKEEILNNKELIEGINSLGLELEPSIEDWVINNGIRVYKSLSIDVIIDANFECFYHFNVTYKDMGDYYKIILPKDIEKLYDGIENHHKDFFKVYKNNMESRLNSGCGFIVNVDNKPYYVCIDEN